MKYEVKMTWVTAIILSLIVTFIGTVAICGGINQAYQVIGLSIICTLGVGLLFWLGLIFVLAFFIKLIFNELFAVTRKTKQLETSLANYIQDAKKAQMSKEEIITRLMENGWSSEVINENMVRHFQS